LQTAQLIPRGLANYAPVEPASLTQGLDCGVILVITCHRKATAGDVQHEITPHDAQANHADCVLLLWLIIGRDFAF
jgi:hypothetical protein